MRVGLSHCHRQRPHKESWSERWSSGAVVGPAQPRWGATCVWSKNLRNNTGSCSRWAVCLLSSLCPLTFLNFFLRESSSGSVCVCPQSILCYSLPTCYFPYSEAAAQPSLSEINRRSTFLANNLTKPFTHPKKQHKKLFWIPNKFFINEPLWLKQQK